MTSGSFYCLFCLDIAFTEVPLLPGALPPVGSSSGLAEAPPRVIHGQASRDWQDRQAVHPVCYRKVRSRWPSNKGGGDTHCSLTLTTDQEASQPILFSVCDDTKAPDVS